jgi:hypothetical protein
MKSRLDMILDRYVLTEKTLDASVMVSDILRNDGGNTVRFIELIDSNKFVAITYPNDKFVNIHLYIFLRIKEFDHKIIDVCNSEMRKKSQERQTEEVDRVHGSYFVSMQDNGSHYIFAYKSLVTGTEALDAILKGTFNNSMRLEALRLENNLVKYGR